MRSAADNNSNDDERGAGQSDIATANEIGKRAHEWTDTGQSDEIGQGEPNPAINTPNVGIDIWRNAACDLQLAPMSGDGAVLQSYRKCRREFDFLSRGKPWQSTT
jgi:hypothetical protein